MKNEKQYTEEEAREIIRKSNPTPEQSKEIDAMVDVMVENLNRNVRKEGAD